MSTRGHYRYNILPNLVFHYLQGVAARIVHIEEGALGAWKEAAQPWLETGQLHLVVYGYLATVPCCAWLPRCMPHAVVYGYTEMPLCGAHCTLVLRLHCFWCVERSAITSSG